VADDAAVLLRDAGQEAGDVDEGEQRDVEGVAEPDEASALSEALMSRTPAMLVGLVGDDADRAPNDPAEADDDVHGVAGLDLQEVLRGRPRGR
jgi:hypothetical protein